MTCKMTFHSSSSYPPIGEITKFSNHVVTVHPEWERQCFSFSELFSSSPVIPFSSFHPQIYAHCPSLLNPPPPPQSQFILNNHLMLSCARLWKYLSQKLQCLENLSSEGALSWVSGFRAWNPTWTLFFPYSFPILVLKISPFDIAFKLNS